MIATDKPNPFHVLGLPTDATYAEVVARGEELYETAETKQQELLYRGAVEQLITKSETRVEYELFEIPNAQYEDSDWERFIRKHKKVPIDTTALEKDIPPPTLEDFDLKALIQLFLDGMLEVAEPDIRAAIEHSPFTPDIQSPLEVKDVIFG